MRNRIKAKIFASKCLKKSLEISAHQSFNQNPNVNPLKDCSCAPQRQLLGLSLQFVF